MQPIEGILETFSLRVILTSGMLSQLIEASEGSGEATQLFEALDRAFMDKFHFITVPEPEYIRKYYTFKASRMEIADGTAYVIIDLEWFKDEIVLLRSEA